MARRGRESVLLGSKLCSERDIVNRGNKANVAFYTYMKVSNCSSWAAPETVMASVDVLQRKHLRQIIKTY